VTGNLYNYKYRSFYYCVLEEIFMANEENKKTPVEGKMLIAEILRQYPEAAYVLMKGLNLASILA
jgi:hypothetical protein